MSSLAKKLAASALIADAGRMRDIRKAYAAACEAQAIADKHRHSGNQSVANQSRCWREAATLMALALGLASDDESNDNGAE